jgi:metal-responsive CopG/Arc/MetJ family transcriptional regulator
VTGRGRPPVGPVIEVRFPPDLVAACATAAAAAGVSRSELIRRAVAAHVGHPRHDHGDQPATSQ